MTNPNDSAFPMDTATHNYHGLTKREYFAAMMMQGVIARGREQGTWKQDVTISVHLADLLIYELNKLKDNGTD